MKYWNPCNLIDNFPTEQIIGFFFLPTEENNKNMLHSHEMSELVPSPIYSILMVPNPIPIRGVGFDFKWVQLEDCNLVPKSVQQLVIMHQVYCHCDQKIKIPNQSYFKLQFATLKTLVCWILVHRSEPIWC